MPLILTAICLLVMPMNAKGLDFGNYAGEENFSYDSNWQVEQNTTAPQYTGGLAEQGYLGAPPVYDGRILRSDEAPA